RVRREFWGYVPDETLDNAALIAEQYQGIRPAPGYPACPDHTEKTTLFKLLDATKNAGIELTEGFSMYPAAPFPAGTSRTRAASTSWSAGSAASRSRTMRSARAGRSRKPSAGWPRTSTTT